MAQRTVELPHVGQIVLSKRRGARNIRLSVTSQGTVRVSLPAWVPYRAGVEFARTRSDWIIQHLEKRGTSLLKDGQRIGKAHRLSFVQKTSGPITARIKQSEIVISSSLDWDDAQLQAKTRQVAERALKQEALTLLPQRLQHLAQKHNFSYSSIQVRKLTSRWGSCSSAKKITLSYYLMQLPWDLIDYVLIHELVHTEHMNHGATFWRRFEQVLPDAKAKRKQIHSHYPLVKAQI